MSLFRIVLALFPLLAAGCMSMVGMAAAPGAAIGTTVASGKTPVDHLVSAITGKDCSIRRNRQGLTYCVEDEKTPPVRVVCYRTLGDVSCYDHPDPFNDRQRAVVEDLGATQLPFAIGDSVRPGMLLEPPFASPSPEVIEVQPEAIDTPPPGSPVAGRAKPAGVVAPL